MEQGRDEVRVMTVHGAKGLEAPIVFLPDTCSTRSGRRPSGLLKLEDADAAARTCRHRSCGRSRARASLAPVQRAKAAMAERRRREERNRLLYVALTRARDRLYVAGLRERATRRRADCWYNLIREWLGRPACRRWRAADGTPVWRIESAQTAKPEAGKARRRRCAVTCRCPPGPGSRRRTEPLITVPLAPSRLAPLESDEEGEPVERRVEPAAPSRRSLSPSALAEDSRFLRGTLTHALLEHLPAHPERALGRRRPRHSSPAVRRSCRAQMRKAIVAETLAILRDPAFAALFGPDSRAEVAIVAEVPHPDGQGSGAAACRQDRPSGARPAIRS